MTEETQRFNEMERAIARQKSYVGSAIIVFLLYTVFYLPGLIANFLYFKDARSKARIAGEKPAGYWALVILFFYGAIPLMLMGFAILVFMGLIVLGEASTEPAPYNYTLY